MSTELERFIHKLHLRTFDKIMPHVKEKFPEATPQQVKDIIKSFVKDPQHLDQRKYYNPIFSDHLLMAFYFHKGGGRISHKRDTASHHASWNENLCFQYRDTSIAQQ